MNALQMGIQQSIAAMTEKLESVLISVEHQAALQQYLQSCSDECVPALPLLNKLEHDRDLRVLTLEDYTVNEGQARSLARCLPFFDEKAFSKIYLNNNGLKDGAMAEIFEGALSNRHIDCFEIAYNKI